jgi:hypothetical protein
MDEDICLDDLAFQLIGLLSSNFFGAKFDPNLWPSLINFGVLRDVSEANTRDTGGNDLL